jgi:hypothetical protein
MLVEPGIFSLTRSVSKYPTLTATLLEYLCLGSAAFYPPLCTSVMQAVTSAFQEAVRFGALFLDL